jgi:RimJ/RimL family protein N-acetyltransferase
MRAQPTRVIVGWDVAVAEWVRQRVSPPVETWGPCWAIGITRGDELIAGVVYNLYRHPMIEASIASTDSSWCSRRNLAAIFAFPFCQLGCTRMGASTDAENLEVRGFLERLGFRREGLLKSAFPGRRDAVLYGMTPEECRWLRNPGEWPKAAEAAAAAVVAPSPQ